MGNPLDRDPVITREVLYKDNTYSINVRLLDAGNADKWVVDSNGIVVDIKLQQEIIAYYKTLPKKYPVIPKLKDIALEFEYEVDGVERTFRATFKKNNSGSIERLQDINGGKILPKLNNELLRHIKKIWKGVETNTNIFSYRIKSK